MISDDVLSQIAALAPNLTAQDIEDLRACDPGQIAMLMKTYEDMGKIPDRGVWVKIAAALEPLLAYAPLAASLATIVKTLA
jgi:hypothetical protein